MNRALLIAVEVALSTLGLLFSVAVWSMALVSIQGMSGQEPLRELVLFFGVSFALAYGLGASCVLPRTGRHRWWPVAVGFATGGAIGGLGLGGALGLHSVFEKQLRTTDGGLLGILLFAAMIGAVTTPVLIGMPLARRLGRKFRSSGGVRGRDF